MESAVKLLLGLVVQYCAVLSVNNIYTYKERRIHAKSQSMLL